MTDSKLDNKLFEYCFDNFRKYDKGDHEYDPFKDPITFIDDDGEPQVVPENIQQEAIILYYNTKNKDACRASLFTFKNGIIFLLVCLFLLFMYFK